MHRSTELFGLESTLLKSDEFHRQTADVFDRQGVFDVDETRRILQAGKQHDWLINFHGEELNPLKSAEVRHTYWDLILLLAPVGIA